MSRQWRKAQRTKKSGWDAAVREAEMKVIGKETTPNVNKSTTAPACIRASSVLDPHRRYRRSAELCTQPPTCKCPRDPPKMNSAQPISRKISSCTLVFSPFSIRLSLYLTVPFRGPHKISSDLPREQIPWNFCWESENFLCPLCKFHI